MRPTDSLVLLAPLALLGCEKEKPPAPTCNPISDTGFDWSCCTELIDYCNAHERDKESCQWICNG